MFMLIPGTVLKELSLIKILYTHICFNISCSLISFLALYWTVVFVCITRSSGNRRVAQTELIGSQNKEQQFYRISICKMKS